jgi:hypothetical protein
MSAVQIIEEQLWRDGFEPFISLHCMTQRAVDVIALPLFTIETSKVKTSARSLATTKC